MKKKLSISDIAAQLNISKTTVSFVLNGKARENHISVSLEKKILKHIEEVGYRPNQFAQGLRSGKTKIIGMLVEDISDPFFSSIARMIEENAYKMGYKIIYSSTENDTEKTKDLIQLYRTRQVDGYIIAPPPGVEQDIQELINDNLPVVLFDRTLPGVDVDSIVVNNFDSAHNAIDHLIKNGYQNTAMITLQSDQIQMKQRELGYTKAIIDAKGQVLIKKLPYHDDKENNIHDIEVFLKSNPQIDSVFFGTNYLAESGLESIRNIGLRINEDIAVIVFDDHNLFRLFSPSITAISQPLQEMSTQIINVILDRLSDPTLPKPVKSIILNCKLLIRNSSSAKRKRSL